MAVSFSVYGHRSRLTNLVEDTDTTTYQPLTTLRTVTKARAKESGSAEGDDTAPTDRVPEDPNFPWGSDSPIHRHQNSSELGIGTDDGDGGLSKRVDWRLRWVNIKDKVKGLWHGRALETGG
ncbi:putative MUC1-Extracellular alpha-1,4-glucan glucosidase [Fusarium austroafricanum]|uniref:Putative MUC1-Extracellular alpha-1,4-glucan glucosidase n=1 Tax=Fusarium austroafricanum TaxID=2364996 RepID=A0A8H4KTP7_9HYPO|nr:putative MUC1-Extracellular alpha-1,4-glucan glucosidase [Fusarium austroafricanum]